jgi:hypothetical protein
MLPAESSNNIGTTARRAGCRRIRFVARYASSNEAGFQARLGPEFGRLRDPALVSAVADTGGTFRLRLAGPVFV